MRRILTRGAAAVPLLLACTSTAPCDCPASRTSLIVYGEVRTATGVPAASAAVRYLLAPPATASGGDPCRFDLATADADPTEGRTDAAGRFRSEVFSTFGPATRCLRVTAHAAGAGTENANVDGLLASFRFTRPDSVGLLLTLR